MTTDLTTDLGNGLNGLEEGMKGKKVVERRKGILLEELRKGLGLIEQKEEELRMVSATVQNIRAALAALDEVLSELEVNDG